MDVNTYNLDAREYVLVQNVDNTEFPSEDQNTGDTQEHSLRNVVCKNGWIECFCVVTFDLELGQKMEFVYPEKSFSKSHELDISYLSFPDSNSSHVGDTTFTIRLHDTEEKEDTEFSFGYVYFRQKKDLSLKRGYFQKSVVLISKYPFIELFKHIVLAVGKSYFDTQSVKIFEYATRQINKWADPILDEEYALPFLGLHLTYRTPVYSQMSRAKIASSNQVNSASPLKKRLGGRRYLFQPPEVNLCRVFTNLEQPRAGIFTTSSKPRGRNVEWMWKCWELCILAQPLLILSPSPAQSSEAVLAILSLIAPLTYAGDYRPYFTVHDSDYKNFSMMGDKQGFEAVILGVTNPFFVKALKNWPNIIAIGSHNVPKKNIPKINKNPLQFNFPKIKIGSSSGSNATSDESILENLTWEYQELFFCKNRTSWITQPDKELINSLIKNDRDKISEDQFNNQVLRRYFEELTEAFLRPLHMCFDSIWCTMRTPFIGRPEYLRLFSADKCMAYIKKYGYEERVFTVGKVEMLEFYEEFTRSVNFRYWMQDTLRKAYCEEVRRLDPNMLTQGLNLVQAIDLFLRVKNDLLDEQALDKHSQVARDLAHLLDTIGELIPEDLRGPLMRTKEANI